MPCCPRDFASRRWNLTAVEQLAEDLRHLGLHDARAVVLHDHEEAALALRELRRSASWPRGEVVDLDGSSGRMPASSQASSELSTASLMVVSSAFEGLSKPSRWRFLAKNSETEISRCFEASDSAVTRGVFADARAGGSGARARGRAPGRWAGDGGGFGPRSLLPRTGRAAAFALAARPRAGLLLLRLLRHVAPSHDGVASPAGPAQTRQSSIARRTARPGPSADATRARGTNTMARVSGVGAALERIAVAAVSWPLLSRVVGRLSDLRLPRPLLVPLIRAYARAYGVDLAEAALPPSAYPSFNAFFTRRLREGARPIDAASGVLVSPSRFAAECDRTRARRRPARAGEGRDATASTRCSGPGRTRPGSAAGQHATLYLSPAMYHRVHSPVDGEVVAWRYVPGRLFPVNAAGVRSVPGLFTRNERVVVLVETAAHGPRGDRARGSRERGADQPGLRRSRDEPRPRAGRLPAEGPDPDPARRRDRRLQPRLDGGPARRRPGPRPRGARRRLVRVGQALWRRALRPPGS